MSGRWDHGHRGGGEVTNTLVRPYNASVPGGRCLSLKPLIRQIEGFHWLVVDWTPASLGYSRASPLSTHFYPARVVSNDHLLGAQPPDHTRSLRCIRIGQCQHHF